MEGESNFAMRTVAFQKILFLFKYNNVCPMDEETFNFAHTLKFLGPSVICGLPLLIGIAGYLYVTIQRDFWSESLSSIVTMVELLSATSVVVLQFNNVKSALIGLKMMDKYEFGEPEICREFCEWIEPIIVPLHHLMRIFCYLVVFFDFINNSYCTNSELRGDPGYICGITMPLWYPFKANYFFVRVLLNICLLVILTKYMPVLNIITMLTIVKGSLILYRTMALRHVIRTDETNGVVDKEHLLSYILQHDEIVKNLESMNANAGYNVLPFFALLPILLALFLYQIFNNTDYQSIFALLPFLTGIIWLCYIGERIEREGNYLLETVYDLEWYEWDPKFNKTFLLFLVRLQQPLKIQMKPITNLNCIYISQLMKGVYSYLVYLKQVVGTEQQSK